jgi:hypothetical protein
MRVSRSNSADYDWSAKYPWIVEALQSLRVCFTFVGRGSGLGCGGRQVGFRDKLHSRAHDQQVKVG